MQIHKSQLDAHFWKLPQTRDYGALSEPHQAGKWKKVKGRKYDREGAEEKNEGEEKVERDSIYKIKKGHRRSETCYTKAALYLHSTIYGVLHMLCGMGVVASWPEEATSFQARVPAEPSSALPKKRTAAEYQRNPLTFSPTHRCAQKGRRLCRWGETLRHDPTMLGFIKRGKK